MEAFWANIGRFVLYSGLTVVIVAVVNGVLFYTMGMRLGSATNVLTVILPALFTGMIYGKRHAARPELGVLFGWSAVATAVMFGVFFALAWATGQIERLRPMFEDSPALIIAIIAGFFAFYVLGTFGFFLLGRRNQIKTGSKQ